MSIITGYNRVYYGLFLVVFVALIILVIIAKYQKDPYDSITSFEQCQVAGYPVTQSYPSECTLPNGKFFTQTLVPGDK